MRDYRLFISHVGKDEALALKFAAALEELGLVGDGDDKFKIVPVYMESETFRCNNDFMEWSERAVKNSDGVLAIVTQNTAEERVSDDGTAANVKVVYDEISCARNSHKDIIVFRENGAVLKEGFGMLLQNIKCNFFDARELEKKAEETVSDIVLHAKRRLYGDPLLEYAGVVEVKLIPSVVSDTSEYLGREKELNKIDECFKEGKRVVCITGFGGMGKTTLAKMYAKAHAEEPVVIQYCSAEETSLKNAVISLRVEHDNPEFDKMTVDEKYAVRLRQLNNLDRRTLVIIDNFNADFGSITNRETLTELSAIEKCKFIISSRQTLSRKDIGLVNVGKLDDKELTELFYRDSHCQKTDENDRLISELIARTNGHTMTVELAAKAVGIDMNGVTLGEVVEGFLSIDAVTRVDDRHDGYDEYETIYAHLRKLFDLSRVNESQKKLLGALSFVARRGLSISELKQNAEYEVKDLIRLCELGYINKSDGETPMYSLHPLMSELAFKDFAQDPEQFEKIINYGVYKKSQSTSNDTLADLDMRLDYAEHIYNRLSSLDENILFNKKYLSRCCGDLGRIAQVKGDIETAERYYKQSFELSKSIYDMTETAETRWNLIFSCDYLGEIAQIKGNLDTAEQYYKQGLELAKKVFLETKLDGVLYRLCVHLNLLGRVAQMKGDIETAEKWYEQSYENWRTILYHTGDIEARRWLATSCQDLGDLAIKKGNLETAERYYKRCFELSKIIYDEKGTIGARRDLELAYARLGNIAKEKGDVETAEKYYSQSYEFARAICNETGTVSSMYDLIELHMGMFTVFNLLSKVYYLRYALKIAEEIYASHVDYKGMYRKIVQMLSDIYKETGDTDEYEKMQEILKSIK